MVAAKEVRRSTGLRDWEKAQTLVRDWEAEGSAQPQPQPEPITIQQACEEYLRDAQAHHLAEKTVYKYRLLFRQIQEFAGARGLRFLRELDTALLRAFRSTWTDGNLAALKKLERLRSFFRFRLRERLDRGKPGLGAEEPKDYPATDVALYAGRDAAHS